MDTSKNRDFIQGANSNKNVANSRVDSSSIIRQHAYLESSRDFCNNRPTPVPATITRMPAKTGKPTTDASNS